MEALVESFNDAVQVSFESVDTFRTHPRYSQYKPKETKSNQEQRRRDLLETQRRNRSDLLNSKRGIPSCPDTSSIESFRSRFRREDRPYRNWLMLSEWLIDVPSDFVTNWIAVLCPIGKRVLLVAEDGITHLYRRNGSQIDTFPSALPGGSRNSGRSGHTILDCIMSYNESILYVLDVILWNVPLADCEAEMRFYMLHSKISETDGINDKSSRNRYQIICLDHRPCIDLPQVMKDYCENVDGVIFFHKEASYTHGRTPLVTWLKTWMIPDILTIEVNPKYIEEKNCPVEKMEVSRWKKPRKPKIERAMEIQTM